MLDKYAKAAACLCSGGSTSCSENAVGAHVHTDFEQRTHNVRTGNGQTNRVI
jgi:hypothetical protein